MIVGRAGVRPALWTFLLCGSLGVAPAIAGVPQAESPELQKLDVSLGHWIFHGETLNARSGQSTPFMWDEHCQWSPNHLFLECTFSNNWNGKAVESLVVDTYNTVDKSYWHYEEYAIGSRGSNPFVSRMDVTGNQWIEHGADAVPGQKNGQRIVYTWESDSHVKVEIQTSPDGTTWTTVNRAEGVKQAR